MVSLTLFNKETDGFKTELLNFMLAKNRLYSLLNTIVRVHDLGMCVSKIIGDPKTHF